jgi:hypothetical protein
VRQRASAPVDEHDTSGRRAIHGRSLIGDPKVSSSSRDSG